MAYKQTRHNAAPQRRSQQVPLHIEVCNSKRPTADT
jgi:hypothetical protein